MLSIVKSFLMILFLFVTWYFNRNVEEKSRKKNERNSREIKDQLKKNGARSRNLDGYS